MDSSSVDMLVAPFQQVLSMLLQCVLVKGLSETIYQTPYTMQTVHLKVSDAGAQ